MIIKKSEFVKSAADYSGFIVSDKPQIVVAGKSNVGKSSFINFLTNNSKLARTSNTPGRTRLVNYFAINDFLLVDLPGYGFAKGSKTEVEAWGMLMDSFFEHAQRIGHVILLVDIRHDPSREDVEFVNYLYAMQIPFSVIATKSDKVNRSEKRINSQRIATVLKIGVDNVFAISSLKKDGKEEVLNLFDKILNSYIDRQNAENYDDDEEYEDGEDDEEF